MPPVVETDLESVKVATEIIVNNTASNKKRSFETSVTLWVGKQKVHAEALIDSGATTNFINFAFVKKHNLEMKQVATPLKVSNSDGTINKQGQITHQVFAKISLGGYVSSHKLYVINLGDKDMMIGYTYLHQHNPEIDWTAGTLRFTRCPVQFTTNVCKNTIEADIDKRPFKFDETSEDIGVSDPSNPHVNWVEITNDNNNLFVFTEKLKQKICASKETPEQEDTRL